MAVKLSNTLAFMCLFIIVAIEAAYVTPCSTDSDCTGANAICDNSTSCVCAPGYSGDGTTCSSVCTVADLLFGISYHAVVGDCSRFVNCDDTTPYVQYCAYGTFWDDQVKTCMLPADANCSLCSGQPDGTQFAYNLTCNSYWQCTGGVAQPQCCPANETFVPGVGCQAGGCFDTCPPQDANTTAAPCPFSQSPDGLQYYTETVPGFGLIRRDCPVGTNYNNVTCGCHDFVAVMGPTTCPMMVDIIYDNTTSTFVDNSTNNAWIQMTSVTLGAEPVFGGSSSLTIFALAGVTYGSDFEISTTFKLTPATTMNNQVILQNGKCSEQASFFVFGNDGISSGDMDLTLTLLTGNDVVAINSTLTAPKNATVRLEFEYPSRANSANYNFELFDDVTGTSIASDSAALPATTTIPRKHGALKIGDTDCAGFTGFIGSIFKTSIRSCGFGV